MNSYLVFSTLNLALAGLVFLLGLIILRENPGQRLNRVVAVMLFFGALGAVLAAVGFLAQRAAGPAAPRDFLASGGYVWELFFPTLFLFACIFPEERAFMRRAARATGQPWWRWWPGWVVVIFTPHVVHAVLVQIATIWHPGFEVPAVGLLKYLAPVLGVAGVLLKLFLLVHRSLFSLVNLGFGIATMLLLYDSYRRARVPRLKLQLRVIAWGLSACLVCYSLATSVPTLLGVEIPETWRSMLIIAALTLGPGSIAYSIVRYKFLDAKLLARRGILYALVSAALVGVYLLVVGQLNRVVSGMAGVDTRVFEPVFLVVALALFQPVVARLEEQVDRVFLKDPGDYRNVLRQLGRDLQTTIDLEVLLSRTIQTLAEALLPRHAYIVALTHEGPMARAGTGDSLSPEQMRRLAGLLPHFSPARSSFRLSDRLDSLAAEERAFLGGELGLALVVPLRWRDELVGALLLGEKVLGTDYTSEDVTLLTTLAGQVSVSLQNALLLRERVAVARFEEELNLARQIQRTSLLSTFPPIPRCEVHALYIPSKQVGGDFYDVVPVGDGSHLVAIADVSGKGMPAALLSAMLQASLRTQAETVPSLSAILGNINSLLFRSTEIGQFATFFLARVDGASLRLSFSNAGHNWPVVVRAAGGGRELLERGGTVLGILEDARFEEAHVALAPGDVVVLYTDGISEATNRDGELYGEERLYALLDALPRGLPARAVTERMLDAVRGFLDQVEAQDDITIVVLRVLEPVPSPRDEAARPEAVAAR